MPRVSPPKHAHLKPVPRPVDQAAIVRAVRSILKAVGEDPDREGLRDTPERVARMYVELCEGLRKDPRQDLKALFHERRTPLADAALDRALVLSLATDGSDGPTEAAGGFLTRALAGDTAAERAELDDALARSDSLSYLERRDAAFRTGPSGTNLMDLRAIVLN